MGFSEVYRLTGLAAVAQVADQNLALYGVTGPQLRENSLFSALMMEELAEAVGQDPRAAYTAGLLRSVGKIALDRLTRDPAYHGTYSVEHGWPLAKWERDFTGLSNTEGAAFILNEWRFPAATIMAIGDHYAPGSAASVLAYLLNFAAGAAEEAGHALPGESSYWELRDEKFAAARLTPEQRAEALDRARAKFERLRVAIT